MNIFQKFLSDEKLLSLSYFSIVPKDVIGLLTNILYKSIEYEYDRKFHGFLSHNNKKREIYCFGANNYGQLGIGSFDKQYVPVLLPFETHDMKIKQIACGMEHTILVTQNGECFGLGNNDGGELGLGKNHCSRVEMLSLSKPQCYSYCNPTKINLKSFHVEEVIAGGYYNFAVTKNKQTNEKQIFCWGQNEDGQLGINKYEDQYVPTEFKFEDKNMKIIQIGCGVNFTSLVINNGDCFVFGNNESGQLGLKKKLKKICIPQKVEITQNKHVQIEFQKIIPGGYHIFAITKNKQTKQTEIYCWGANFYGQLGMEEKRIYSPVQMINSNIQRIICGIIHTVFIMKNGESFSSEDIEFNQVMMFYDQFFKTEKKEFSEIYIGRSYNFIMFRREKKIHCWGSNSEGQLGMKKSDKSKTPVLFEIEGKKCSQVVSSLFGNHNFAVCE